MNRNIRLLTTFVLAGCAADLKTTPAVTAVGDAMGTASTTTLGAAGGTVRSGDGKLELVVPAGALAADTALTVTPLSVTAPGGVRAWRLGPEGTTFSTPATVKFNFAPADLAGSTPTGLRVAFQDSQRRWKIIKASTVEATSISVTTTHLSDWSLLLGWQLRPGTASAKPGESVSLTVRYCNAVPMDPGTEFELVSLAADCQDDDGLAPIIGAWAVNGVTGGSSANGTVQPGSPTGVYTAPSQAPTPATVAVSVELNPPEFGKTLLVSNVTIGATTPKFYNGTFTHHTKAGGAGTSILPYEQRLTGTLSLERSGSSSSYSLTGGMATAQFTKDNGITNCHCAVSNVSGPLDAASGALVLDNGAVTGFQFSANSLLLTLTCTGTTDPSCSTETVAAIPFVLAGRNPACTGTSMLTFTNPLLVDGSWTEICPSNPQVVGRVTEATWSLQGSN